MNSANGLEFTKAALVEVFDAKSLEADLIMPKDPKGVVLVVHGRGSSRLSPRNRYVAQMLRDRGLGALLLDTETPEERERARDTGQPSIDIEEMAKRIGLATDWLQKDTHAAGLPIGYLGAGTGAAAAFMAAAERPNVVRAIVARGGRLELVRGCLPRVIMPALLIVGARDIPVVHRNREAIEHLGSSSKQLEIVPGAHHLFEEPGTLAAAAMHASNFLARHLPNGVTKPPLKAAVHLQ